MTPPVAPVRDLRGLLKEYAEVCNRALARNEERFWYRQVLRITRSAWNEATFEALVYADDPGRPAGVFTLHFDPGLRRLSVLPAGAFEVDFTWKVPIDYLEDVVLARPEWYVEHPARLDGVWMTHRLRDVLRARGGTLAVALAGLAIGAATGALAARAWGGGARRRR